MEFPVFLLVVVDGADLPNVLHFNVRTRLVFDEDVFPGAGMFRVIRTFGEADAIVFGVVTEAFLLPRHHRGWVFLVDAVALVVPVVLFAVAGRVISVVIRGVSRVEGFSEFLQNVLC